MTKRRKPRPIWPIARKMNGKRFTNPEAFKKKKDAKRHAASLRKKGYKARTVSHNRTRMGVTKRRGRHAVYRRGKGKRRR